MKSRSAVRGWGLMAAVAVVSSVATPLAGAAPAPAQKPAAPTPAKKPAATVEDYNGDGYQDVAVAGPYGRVGGVAGAGFVTVVYGGKAGPQKARKQLLHQDSPGIVGKAEKNDMFGWTTASADLDRDGYTDLLVGANLEDPDSGPARQNAGAVTVIWGGKSGLKGSSLLFTGSKAENMAGNHLVTGDFDGDGDQDAALTDANPALEVLSGPFRRDGKPAARKTVPAPGSFYALELDAGDVNKDGRTDILAIAAGHVTVPGRIAEIWYGTAKGPAAPKSLIDPRGKITPGHTFDIGDINKDGAEDIVFGRSHTGEDHPRIGGEIVYVPGSAKGPVVTRSVKIDQETPGVPGVSEGGGDEGPGPDHFGAHVSIGDVDGDGYREVAVGVPGEDHRSLGSVGNTIVLRGTASGPTGKGARLLNQDTPGVPDTGERNDSFGSQVKLIDTNGDRRAELFAAATGENRNEGAYWALPGTASGPTGKGSAFFNARQFGVTTPGGAYLGAVFTR
ncbi:VCBS repeat-containing protein [Streptomyces yaizuensis]|uniref:VCBS repeat-containing protein n=1 Tax=Streptomyces yaizuensis TaxID=2989713 RepID=A0ABQ5PAF6_9ACTN|nr:VCBS repeat-containing protein [Streptomyces sp. YSPA8]GLF99556.1 VCBS repeat-containing protein [Streptomyces sp. YSPA8]